MVLSSTNLISSTLLTIIDGLSSKFEIGLIGKGRSLNQRVLTAILSENK